jgi:hypothetical protein
MTAMSDVYFDEGLVEVVDADEVVTTESIVRVSSRGGNANSRTSTRTSRRRNPSIFTPRFHS